MYHSRSLGEPILIWTPAILIALPKQPDWLPIPLVVHKYVGLNASGRCAHNGFRKFRISSLGGFSTSEAGLEVYRSCGLRQGLRVEAFRVCGVGEGHLKASLFEV